MKITSITYFGQPAKIICDEKCDKAWGMNSRPCIYLCPNSEEDVQIPKSEVKDWDDYYYVPDNELDVAPDDTGTYEGFEAKPTAYGDDEDHKHNKWCCRECERCSMTKRGYPDILPELKDFSGRVYNCGNRQKRYDKGSKKELG